MAIHDAIKAISDELSRNHSFDSFMDDVQVKVTDTNDIDKIREVLQSVFSITTNEYEYSENIQEQESLILDLITSKEKTQINFIARTKSGKTLSLLLIALKYNIRMILLVPYRINAEQLPNNDLLQGKVRSVHGNVTPEQVKEIIKNDKVIISTYDSLRKLIVNDLTDLHKYILVIDEYHNFITQYKIRNEAINYVNDFKNRFAKVITLTATPEGIIERFNLLCQTIQFKNKYDEKSSGHHIVDYYYIMAYFDLSLDKMANHIMNHNLGGKIVIFINDIDHLNSLKQLLIDQGVNEQEIAILNKDEKESEDYKYIGSYENIHPSTRFLLTTQVISDGININDENIKAVYLFDIKDPILLRQFISRFREGVIKCYDFIRARTDSTVEFPFQGSEYLNRYVFLKELTVLCNRYLKIRKINDEKNAKDWFENSSYFKLVDLSAIHFNNSTNEFEVSELMLKWDILDRFHKVIMSYPVTRREYLNMFESLNVQIEYLGKPGPLHLKSKQDIIIEQFREMGYENEFLDILKRVHYSVLERCFIKMHMSLYHQGFDLNKFTEIYSMIGVENKIRTAIVVADNLKADIINPKTFFEKLKSGGHITDNITQIELSERIYDVFDAEKSGKRLSVDNTPEAADKRIGKRNKPPIRGKTVKNNIAIIGPMTNEKVIDYLKESHTKKNNKSKPMTRKSIKNKHTDFPKDK